jgi:PAS domain-containing protein/HPt (histidine-containing phosphotransfer) domain-containing protein/two-component sensor histidine kinase
VVSLAMVRLKTPRRVVDTVPVSGGGSLISPPLPESPSLHPVAGVQGASLGDRIISRLSGSAAEAGAAEAATAQGREAEVFRYLAERSPVPAALTDRRTSTILFRNAEFVRAFGDEVTSSRAAMALYEDPAARDVLIAKVRAQGGVRNEHVRFRRVDGTVGDFLVSMLPVPVDGLDLLYTYSLDISERVQAESRLRERSAEMSLILDNVAQGLCIVDANGILRGEPSATATRFFGAHKSGSHLTEVFRPKNAEYAEYFAMAWDSLRDGILPLALALEQLPRRLSFEDKTIDIAVHPIGVHSEDCRPEALLVIFSDVSQALATERSGDEQRALMALFTHLQRDRGGVVDFLQETDTRLTRVAQLASEGSHSADLRRDVHTLKGNFALYGLDFLAAQCHQLEEQLRDSTLIVGDATDHLASSWRAFRERARAFVDTRSGDLDVTGDEVATLRDLIERGEAKTGLLALVDSWKEPSLKRRLERVGAQATNLALRLGKGQLRFVYDDGRLRLPAERWAPFWGVFAHVIRNAIDHGLEFPAERLNAGKSEAGRLAICAKLHNGCVAIEVEDDGRGLDWPRLRDAAKAMGLPHGCQSEIVDALFADGVTTKTDATDISGRGVGMAAVKACVAAMGGTIQVTSRSGAGTTFRFEIPHPG